jgi:hypothetical protein
VRRSVPALLTAIFALMCGATAASAATITSVSVFSLPGFSTGSLGPIGVTPSPNNDNAAAANPNTIPYSIFFNTFGLLEVEFNVENSGGTTEYRVTQAFINNSGQPWSNFVFELGFGTGANFVRSDLSDALDFDTPDGDPAPFSSGFTTLDHQADLVEWTGGVVPSIGVVAFNFAIDLPDDLQGINPFDVSRFTLRQTPNFQEASPVPEPTTMLLFGTGLVGIVMKRRRRRACL